MEGLTHIHQSARVRLGTSLERISHVLPENHSSSVHVTHEQHAFQGVRESPHQEGLKDTLDKGECMDLRKGVIEDTQLNRKARSTSWDGDLGPSKDPSTERSLKNTWVRITCFLEPEVLSFFPAAKLCSSTGILTSHVVISEERKMHGPLILSAR